MSTLPITTNWTKVPGPNFVGGPDGRIIDINDWRVQVRATLRLDCVMELTRFEANDPLQFEMAQKTCIAKVNDKVYGEAYRLMLELESQLRFELGRDQNPETMNKFVEIRNLLRPTP